MVDVNKLAKGDKIINDYGQKFIVTDLTRLPTWLIMREIYPDGTQEVFSTSWYVEKTNFEKYKKVYEWSDWRKYTCPDGEIAQYRTNRRYITFKRDDVSVDCTCHCDDVFNLEYGLGLCWERWKEKTNLNVESRDNMSTSVVAPKKINVNKLENQQFGDYIAIKVTGKDRSRHNIWMCVCPNCGDIIYATAYDLMHGRKKTICKKCAERKGNADTAATSARDYDTTGFITTIGDPYPVGDTECAHAVATSSTTWYEDGSVTTTYQEYNKTDAEDAKTSEDTVVTNINTDYTEEHPLINHREIYKDLLDFPVYYHIAHCIPADLTFHGETAKRINKLYNLEYLFNEGHCKDWCDVGEVLCESNVFTLLPNRAKFTKVDKNDLKCCLRVLAEYCAINGIQYLAMPFICTGGNKLPWKEVKSMILKAFVDAYDSMDEAYPIYIDFCYK